MHAIDYRLSDYASEVRRITGGQGVDVVFDPLGGLDWRKGYGLLRSGGRLVAYGFSNLQQGGRRSWLSIVTHLAAMPRFTPLRLMTDNRSIAGVSLAPMWGAPLREPLEEIVRSCAEGKIDPQIDLVYPFDAIADAHRRIEQRQNVGKVLLSPLESDHN